MAHEPISFIDEVARRNSRRQHEYSLVAGKLFTIFELLCSVVRETQELAEDHNEPIMREIGGTDVVGERGLLRDALRAVAQAGSRALDAADPEQGKSAKSLRKRP